MNFIKGEGYMEGDIDEVMDTLKRTNIEYEFDDQFHSCEEI